MDDESGYSPNYATIGIGLAFVIAAVTLGVFATPLAAWPFLIPAAALLGSEATNFRQHRRSLPEPAGKEQELLSAIRSNGGWITPAEAAMETSLTVREADGMLSELAGGGHLLVESRDGTLRYVLPDSREDNPREVEG